MTNAPVYAHDTKEAANLLLALLKRQKVRPTKGRQGPGENGTYTCAQLGGVTANLRLRLAERSRRYRYRLAPVDRPRDLVCDWGRYHEGECRYAAPPGKFNVTHLAQRLLKYVYTARAEQEQQRQRRERELAMNEVAGQIEADYRLDADERVHVRSTHQGDALCFYAEFLTEHETKVLAAAYANAQEAP
jgi:hypothetical protein